MRPVLKFYDKNKYFATINYNVLNPVPVFIEAPIERLFDVLNPSHHLESCIILECCRYDLKVVKRERAEEGKIQKKKKSLRLSVSFAITCD